MKNESIYTKKIETERCFVVLYWKENPEFKLTKIYLFDKAKLTPEKGVIFDSCREEHKKIKELETSIKNYFKEKKSLKFSLRDLDLSGHSCFSKKVLIALAGIPFGKVTTYKKLAELSGVPGACRAVGSVMAKNPFPLLIPCHRVIKTDFRIGEFGPGSSLKKFLLCHEISENAFDRYMLKDKKVLI